MIVMRKFALALLTLLMITPSLACAMPVCKGESAAEHPCHPSSHDQQNEVETEDTMAGMLLQDCMGIDFMAQDTANNDFKPNQTLDTLDFAWADLTFSYNFEPQNINGIRGPPLGADATSPSRSIYLTTQRLRI